VLLLLPKVTVGVVQIIVMIFHSQNFRMKIYLKSISTRNHGCDVKGGPWRRGLREYRVKCEYSVKCEYGVKCEHSVKCY
jgi:hypothetical protein